MIRRTILRAVAFVGAVALGTACSTSNKGGTNGGPSGSSGGGSGGSGSGGGSSSGAGDCANAAAIPAGASRSISLSLTGVAFGSGQSVGLDLDGKCTTATSTDVCTLASGATTQIQVDGASGIDNSWGANIVPAFGTTGGVAPFQQADVMTDGSGSGTIAFTFQGQTLEFAIADTYVVMSGASGTLAAVAPTSGVFSAFQAVAGSESTSLCSTFQAGAGQQIEEASDILSDGSNSAGQNCNAISIGLTFTGSSPLTGLPPAASNPCNGGSSSGSSSGSGSGGGSGSSSGGSSGGSSCTPTADPAGTFCYNRGQQVCTDVAGTTITSCETGSYIMVSSCPALNAGGCNAVVGCCTGPQGQGGTGATGETCYYAGYGGGGCCPESEADCKGAGGTWSTTP